MKRRFWNINFLNLKTQKHNLCHSQTHLHYKHTQLHEFIYY